MWKIAQIEPAMHVQTGQCQALAVKPTQVAPSSAISRKINSPAYMLPNSRMPSDTVLCGVFDEVQQQD